MEAFKSTVSLASLVSWKEVIQSSPPPTGNDGPSDTPPEVRDALETKKQQSAFGKFKNTARIFSSGSKKINGEMSRGGSDEVSSGNSSKRFWITGKSSTFNSGQKLKKGKSNAPKRPAITAPIPWTIKDCGTKSKQTAEFAELNIERNQQPALVEAVAPEDPILLSMEPLFRSHSINEVVPIHNLNKGEQNATGSQQRPSIADSTKSHETIWRRSISSPSISSSYTSLSMMHGVGSRHSSIWDYRSSVTSIPRGSVGSIQDVKKALRANLTGQVPRISVDGDKALGEEIVNIANQSVFRDYRANW
ncbi:hypothetical protein ABW19_dt0203954 [Dactylella cylindrospora]|nr:hypothetical protein ABW19_dt0203954 [Dactylella cylindrospora]